MNEVRSQYLEDYLVKLSDRQRAKIKNITADYFCSDKNNANICSELVLQGEKTATCGMKYWYESGLGQMPQVGNLQIVTDWDGNPTSIIEITEIIECKFSEVTEDFAALEGEGDKSLNWWRKAHWNYFEKECQAQGINPSEDMTLVLEKFKVVYP